MQNLLRRAPKAGVFTLIVALVFGLLAPAAVAQTETAELELPPFVTITGEDGRWTTFEAPLGRVYGNATSTDGFVAVTGGTLVDVCSGTPPPIVEGRFRQKADGTWITSTLPGGTMQFVSVYETDLDVFVFFDQQCPLFFAEDPAFAEPFAVGEVLLQDVSWNQPEPFGPIGSYRNGILGEVTTPDGATYRLGSLVKYDVTDPEAFPDFARDLFKFRRIR